jgi:hypothetical protein
MQMPHPYSDPKEPWSQTKKRTADSGGGGGVGGKESPGAWQWWELGSLSHTLLAAEKLKCCHAQWVIGFNGK